MLETNRGFGLIGLLLAVAAISIIVILFFLDGLPFRAKPPPIVNPEGVAAFKYYPEGANAPDFRDGSNGPVEVELVREANKLTLSWDSTVGVTAVKVIDLGKIYDLSDHKQIWAIATAGENTISPPYTLGEVPAGFSKVEKSPTNLELKADHRYTIELLALNPEGLPTLGTYTFSY